MTQAKIMIKVRLGTEVLYNTKIFIDLKEPVSNLKSKVCQMDDTLVFEQMAVVYCGYVMEDHEPLLTYELYDGATVHVFKEIKPEKIADPKPLSFSEMQSLVIAMQAIQPNSTFGAAMDKLSDPEELMKIILANPGLSEDPVAITMLQHPEILTELQDCANVKELADHHPVLASTLIKLAEDVKNADLKSRFNRIRALERNRGVDDGTYPRPILMQSFNHVHAMHRYFGISSSRPPPTFTCTSTEDLLESNTSASTSIVNTADISEPSTSASTSIATTEDILELSTSASTSIANTVDILEPSTSASTSITNTVDILEPSTSPSTSIATTEDILELSTSASTSIANTVDILEPSTSASTSIANTEDILELSTSASTSIANTVDILEPSTSASTSIANTEDILEPSTTNKSISYANTGYTLEPSTSGVSTCTANTGNTYTTHTGNTSEPSANPYTANAGNQLEPSTSSSCTCTANTGNTLKPNTSACTESTGNTLEPISVTTQQLEELDDEIYGS